MARRRGDRSLREAEQLESGGGWRPASRRERGGRVGRSTRPVSRVLNRFGGIPPRAAALGASIVGRRARGKSAEACGRGIAAPDRGGLGRAPSTVSREVARNGGRRSYRAVRAEGRAARRPATPPAKLARNRGLREAVERLLLVSGRPSRSPGNCVTIIPTIRTWSVPRDDLPSLFVQGRGALRAELARYLRTGRAHRRPAGRGRPSGELTDMVLLSERPAEVEDRAIPGHWEGDLLVGKLNGSAIGTLVERQTRYVMLVALPDGRSAEQFRTALAERIQTLPGQLRRSLTWDRGKEMSDHVQVHRRDRGHRLLLRSPQPLAAGQQREHQRSAPPVLPPRAPTCRCIPRPISMPSPLRGSTAGLDKRSAG